MANPKKQLESVLRNILHTISLKEYFVLCCAILFFLGLENVITAFLLDEIVQPLKWERNVFTDILSGYICMYIAFHTWKYYADFQYRFSRKHLSIILFLLFVYVYYRCIDCTFYFVGYGGSQLDYCLSWVLVPLLCILIRYIGHRKVNVDEPTKISMPRLLLDEPITDSVEDILSYNFEVEKMFQSIKDMDCKSNSYSIGIIGTWGAGKTSFLNLLKEKIKSDRTFELIEFNVNSSASVKHIQSDFLALFCHKLKKYYSGFSRLMKDYANALQLIEEPHLLHRVFNSLSLADVEQNRDKIKELLIDLEKKIVVLIDDMDRLTGKEMLEVLKLINKNASFPNTFFITAYDKNYVNKVLEEYLHVNHVVNYSDKFFNYEYMLPQRKYTHLANYLIRLLKEDSKEGRIKITEMNIDSNVKQLEQYLENLLPTVRDVKRFYSLFISDYVGIQDEVHFYDFLLVTLIKYKNKDLYKNLAYGKYVVEHDRVPTFYIFKLPVKSTYEEEILASLFPNPKHPIEYYFRHDYRKLCRKNSFDHYFYNYEEGRLYFKGLNKLLSTGYPLADAFDLIKKWNEEGKEEDYNDYLLTYININVDISRDKLRRYWQILAYCCVYSGLVTSYQKILLDFIRPDYVDLILKKQAFSDLSDYKNYFENSIAGNVISTILNQHNVELISPHYRFGLIQTDSDDNKFVDCAIVANAEFLVSNDSHFKILEQIPFPKVNLICLKSFTRMLNGYLWNDDVNLLNEPAMEYNSKK